MIWTRKLSGAVAGVCLAAILLPASIWFGTSQRSRARDTLIRDLRSEAGQEATKLSSYFERARAVDLLTARNPAFRDFYLEPGSRSERLRHGRPIADANRALTYVERLFPNSIGEACFIDRHGAENARVVDGKSATVGALSPDESRNPFFAKTFHIGPGRVYQAEPYVSPDTQDWVISTSTVIPWSHGESPGLVHFEVTIESFRRQAAVAARSANIRVVDADTGAVILSSKHPQKPWAPLGDPTNDHFRDLADLNTPTGLLTVGDRLAAFHRVASGPDNGNHWIAVASLPIPGAVTGMGVGALALIAISSLLLLIALLNVRLESRGLGKAAYSDVLTGLGNRRALMDDLARAKSGQESVLLLCDLNGFKIYNDTFGHQAGDQLLALLGTALHRSLDGKGQAYRMGGDEFCVLTPVGPEGIDEIVETVTGALTRQGEGFKISTAYGEVLIPSEATDPSEILRIADTRMYRRKHGGRPSAGRQSASVLIRALLERDPALEGHIYDVANLAVEIGSQLGLSFEALDQLRHAATLHDIGKMAIPDDILNKSDSLSDEEWGLVERHPMIGERILQAAPSLSLVARIVRSTHERFDGTGYPDGASGEDIPLASRIISVCDAFDAMTRDRSYKQIRTVPEALAELRRCSRGQFDPQVVEVLIQILNNSPHYPRVDQSHRSEPVSS